MHFIISVSFALALLLGGGQCQMVTLTPESAEIEASESQDIAISADLSDFLAGENETAVVQVNITFVSSDPDIMTIMTEEELVYELESGGGTEVNASVSVQGGEAGSAILTVDICVTVNGTTNHSSCSVNVTVTSLPEVKLDYALIYINMMMCCITITFVACSATMRGLSETWSHFGWIVVGFLIYSVLRPTISLVLIRMIRFMPPQSVGILATVCSPPSMLAIPVAALLQADVYLMIGLALSADVLAACILPVWILQFGKMDANLTIEPRLVPYGIIVVYFLLTIIAVATGMAIRRLRPDVARSLANVTPIVTFVAVIVAVSLDAYHLRTTLYYVDARSAIYASIEPVLILIGGFLLAACTSLDPTKVKAVCVFLLIKGQSVTTALLNAADAQRDVELAVASSSFLSLVSLVIGLLLGVAQCLAFRSRASGRHGYNRQDLSLEIDGSSTNGVDDDDSVDFTQYLRSSMLMVGGFPEKEQQPANQPSRSSFIAPFIWM